MIPNIREGRTFREVFSVSCGYSLSTMESIVLALGRKFLPSSLYERLASSSIARRLARGSLWSLFGSAAARILVLVAMILVARVLGQVSFGELGLIQSTLGMAGLMAGMGLGETATRFVAKYATSDPLRAGRVIALVMSISVGTVVLTAVVVISLSGLIAGAMLNAPHLQSALEWGSLLMAATAFRGIQGGVFAGLEKFDALAKLNILDGLVSLITMVLLAQIMGVQGAVLGLALGTIMVWLVGRILLMKELSTRGIAVRYRGCGADWRILTGYSLPSLLASLVATPVLWFAMTLVARSGQGFAGLGLYNAAYQWHGPMVFIPMILLSVSIPVLVQEWEAGREERFRAVTLWMCGLMLALSLPPAVVAALLSPWIMSLYGPEFREGWTVLILLLAAAPLHALAKIASGALLGMNRAWWVLGVNLGWGATLLAVTAWLVPTRGVLGLAIAFLAAYAILGTLSLASVLVGSRRCAVANSRSHTASRNV
jgi:O-antigen/teichoic acid export membrane protein